MPNMWTSAILSIFALLAEDCYAGFKPTSVPISIVPITSPWKNNGPPQHDAFLTVDVAVGTPALRMNLTLDFYWDSSFLFDSSPASLKCYPVSPRHYYNGTASSTFSRPLFNLTYSGDWLGYPYGGDCDTSSNPEAGTSGHVAQDTWRFGPQSVPSVPFVYGQNHSNLLSNRWSSDGVLGFSMYGNCVDYFIATNCSTALETLVGAYDEKVVSLYLQRPASRVITAIPSGSLTFGAKDSEHCSDWTPLDKNSYQDTMWLWSAAIDSVTIGPDEFTKFDPVALLDPTSEFIYTESLEDIAYALSAEYDFASDLYVVQCDAVKSFPDVVFTMSNKDFWLPATDYARQTASDVGKKTCTLMFSDYWTVDETWRFGTTFLRNYCVALDYSSGLVNIGRLKA